MSAHDEKELAGLLLAIMEADTDCEWRYGMVLWAVSLAHGLGVPAGFRLDQNEPEWLVAYIELSTGQVSWHIPQHQAQWDGHTTVAKFERIRLFAAQEFGWDDDEEDAPGQN